MSFVGVRRLSGPGLALFATCLCSCLTLPRGGGQESISLPFMFEGESQTWEVGHSAGNELQRIDEFVRPGQTVDDWTELVTVQTYNKASGLGSIEDQMAAHRNDLIARCPGSTLDVVSRPPDGVLYEIRAVNCPQGGDEQVLARILDGTWNRFVVQYGVRGALTLTPERRKEWTEKLMAIEIMAF